ncbi:MAG: hypothetical protein SF182_29305 [Deltaproteobacteria bacterium]|nr:hypothetical protein [Deltaproteobacteria bacterium]
MVRVVLAALLTLALAAIVGCGDGSDAPAPDIDVIVERICLYDPAGLTPTVCTVLPTRTPTPTPKGGVR